MADATVLRAAARAWVPWKNGGGVTSVVASHPAEAGDDWDWRVSVATVAEPGPFSHFPGVDRILTVLSGTLELAGEHGTVTVSEGRSASFRGEASISGRPLAEAVKDLNLMVRREGYDADVEHVAAPLDHALTPRGGTRLLYFVGGGRVVLDGKTIEMGAHDALLFDGADVGSIRVTDAAFVHVLRIAERPTA